MSLSVMIPTIGRECLSKLLAELVPQLCLDDEVLVVGDGPQPRAAEIIKGIDARVIYHEHGPDHAWGHPQRNWAMRRSRGTHLMWFDDDDALLPEALRTVRSAIASTPHLPLMFRMRHIGGVIWWKREVCDGNVSTQMFVAPNVPSRLGRWGHRYQGDLDFITSTLQLYPSGASSLVWREEVIAVHGIDGKAPR